MSRWRLSLRSRSRRIVPPLLADLRSPVGHPPARAYPSAGLDPSRPRGLLELGELVGPVGSRCEHGEEEPALGPGRPGAIGLSSRHPAVIMTPAMPDSDLAA